MVYKSCPLRPQSPLSSTHKHNELASISNFWRHHPALLYGLFTLFGIWAALAPDTTLLIPIFFIGMPLLFCMRCRLFLALLLACTAYFFTIQTYSKPQLSSEGTGGTGSFSIHSISCKSTLFGKHWIYQGILENFKGDDQLEVKCIPCKISFPVSKKIHRPLANRAYQVTGCLKESSSQYYTLKILKDTPWYPIENRFSLAETRFQAKTILKQYIKDHISSLQAASFLTGIATGDFEDILMAYEFSRFGLQHIMAISGFHFSILASGLFFLLSIFLKRNHATLLLLLLLSFYVIFLGLSASILRAYISILVPIATIWVGRRSSGLNNLGIALLITLFIHPLYALNIGFQFSFAVTGAILLIYPPCDLFFQQLLTKRTLTEAIEMNRINQLGYCCTALLRQGLALSLAVNLVACPMTLYFFQKFPFWSLLYNLFFPFLVTFSMLLLLFGFIFSWLPFLADFFHSINSTYTQWMLDFTYYFPPSLDWMLYSSVVTGLVVVSILSFLLIAGIWLWQQKNETQSVLI